MSRSGSSAWPAASAVLSLSKGELAQFRAIGRDIFLRGLVSSHSGNLSLRQGGYITITRHGSQLGHLGKLDLVTTGLEVDLPARGPAPSLELPRHRAIYRATSARAIVHAHPPHAVALSLLAGEISPRDMEGAYLLDKVPVVEPRDVAEESLAAALSHHPIAMLRGHGSFAVGDSLEAALQWTTALEDSCLILLWLKLAEGRG